MQEIVNAPSHVLAVDTAKNRIYFTITGHDVSWNVSLTQHWERARALVSTGFTMLADASQLQHISRNWVEISVKLQQLLRPNGLARTAELLSERVVMQLGILTFPSHPYAKEEIFTSRQEAEAWLDSLSMSCHN